MQPGGVWRASLAGLELIQLVGGRVFREVEGGDVACIARDVELVRRGRSGQHYGCKDCGKHVV